jgi:hypothetical protein
VRLEKSALASRARVSAPSSRPKSRRANVRVATDQQQADDDPGEPAGDQKAAEAGRNQDDQSGRDLDSADDVHRVLGAAQDEVIELGRHVLRPIADHHLGELVEAEQDRRYGERDAQQHERLGGRVAAQHRRGGNWNWP